MPMLTYETKRAAKRHVCWWCAEDIEGGEQYHVRSGVDEERRWWRVRYHLECMEAEMASDLSDQDYEEGLIGEGRARRGQPWDWDVDRS